MLKKIINFFDTHRVVLVFTVLLLISLVFLSIKSYQFLNHDFKPVECTKEIDNTYCYHNDLEILKEPEKYKLEFFKKNKESVNDLKKVYDLREFGYYTAYYYEVASSLYKDEELYEFFSKYSNTYMLEDFYLKNSLYFELFYNYKLPSTEEEKVKKSNYTKIKFY